MMHANKKVLVPHQHCTPPTARFVGLAPHAVDQTVEFLSLRVAHLALWMFKTTVGQRHSLIPLPYVPFHRRDYVYKTMYKTKTVSDSNGDGIDTSRVFSTYTNPVERQSTVIIGAGIMGCATAYYLSHSGNTKPDTIHLVEASPELFASASGKAAGFCASDCRNLALYM